MGRYILRADVQNFSDSILDSNDLSTFRGGSIAALNIGRGVEEALKAAGCNRIEPLFAGGSKCGFAFESAQPPEQVASRVRSTLARFEADIGARPGLAISFPGSKDIICPFEVMTVAVSAAAVPAGTTDRDVLEALDADNRASQSRGWSLNPELFDAGTRAEDPLQRMRGGSKLDYLPRGKRGLMTPAEYQKWLDKNKEMLERQKADPHVLSPHVAQRRKFGRYARQSFYNDEIRRYNDDALRKNPKAAQMEQMDNFPSFRWADQKPEYSFTDSLQDMISDPPKELPASLKNSIAVVYADGNGVGKIVQKIGEMAFDLQIRKLQAGMLRNLLEWLRKGACSEENAAFGYYEKKGKDDEEVGRFFLRFETLMWGGEEMSFALPSWLALAFVEQLLAWTRGWTVAGEPLTFAIGVAIANAKTPIRQLRSIASEAADACKEFTKDGEKPLRSVSSVSIEVFESLSPPDTGLAGHRRHVYFADPSASSAMRDSELAARLAFPGDGFSRMLDAMRNIVLGSMEQAAVPRSQLYRVLRDVRSATPLGLADAGADDKVKQLLGTHARRAGGDVGFKIDDITLPAFNLGSGFERGIALDLAQVVTLWDYAVPRDGRILDASRNATGGQP